MTRQLCGRTSGIPLSAGGLDEAKQLSIGLASRSLTAIYSSPIERALATAESIAHPHRLVPIIDERLTELDFGEWTGKTFEELADSPMWVQYNRARSSTRPPGGEAPLSVLARSREALDELGRRHGRGTVAVVTHGDVIRSLLTSLLNMVLDDLLRFEISPASVTEVSYGAEHPLVHRVNTIYAER